MSIKKVCHLVESYSPLSETFIYDLIKNQEAAGLECTVLAFDKVSDKNRDVRNCIELKPNKGLAFYIRSIYYHLTKNKEGFNYLRYIMYQQDLKKHLSDQRPDLLHCHFATMGILGLKAANNSKFPVICSFYGFDISRNLKLDLWVSRYKKYLHKLNGAIAISNHIGKKVAAFVSENKIKLIHLPFKAELINNTYPSQRLETMVKCLFVGRLVDKKSPLELIQSFAKAKSLEKRDLLCLTIIGDGPLMDQSIQLVNKLNLNGSVTFKGSQPNSLVKEELKKSHIYLQHSVTAPDGDQEGQGVSLVEASALGLPVITTNHNGFSDVIVDQETGFLVEEHDVNEMGKKIYELSRNVGLWDALGENGCNHIKKHFNSDLENEKMISFYNQLLK